MNWKFWTRWTQPIADPVAKYSPQNPPAFLEDRRVYVCHGENMVGNCITRIADEGVDHIYSVAGWLASAPFPRIGDELLMEMSQGGWGRYVFARVKICGDPNDMFTGTVFGAYGLSDQKPKTKQCDEFVLSSGLQFFRT